MWLTTDKRLVLGDIVSVNSNETHATGLQIIEKQYENNKALAALGRARGEIPQFIIETDIGNSGGYTIMLYDPDAEETFINLENPSIKIIDNEAEPIKQSSDIKKSSIEAIEEYITYHQ